MYLMYDSGLTVYLSLQVDLKNRIFKNAGPVDKKKVPIIQMGIQSMAMSSNRDIIVGSGTGMLYVIKRDNLSIKRYII